MRRLLVTAVVLGLLAQASPAQARNLWLLWDKTSAAAGSVDSGALNTRDCTQIIVLVTALDAAAPSSYTVQACRNSSVSSCAGFGVTLTAPAIGATSDSGSMGPGSASARGVPPFLRYQCTGGAASRCQVTVWCESGWGK